MKKTYKPYKAAAVIAAAVIMTSGCGQKQQEGSTMQTGEETSASGTETSSAVQRPNPMTAVTDETAFQSLGVYMALPEEAEDPLCFILNGEVAEIQFSYHEIPYSYRASNTAEDFAGIFERFTDQILTVEFKDLEGGETVSAQIRTTQSGGRFASWKWKDTSYTLYTASNVSDADISSMVTILLELISQR